MRNDAKEERDRQLFELNLQLQGNKISASELMPSVKGLKQNMRKNLKRQGLKPKRLKFGIIIVVVAVERLENTRGMTAMVTSILHARMNHASERHRQRNMERRNSGFDHRGQKWKRKNR